MSPLGHRITGDPNMWIYLYEYSMRGKNRYVYIPVKM